MLSAARVVRVVRVDVDVPRAASELICLLVVEVVEWARACLHRKPSVRSSVRKCYANFKSTFAHRANKTCPPHKFATGEKNLSCATRFFTRYFQSVNKTKPQFVLQFVLLSNQLSESSILRHRLMCVSLELHSSCTRVLVLCAYVLKTSCCIGEERSYLVLNAGSQEVRGKLLEARTRIYHSRCRLELLGLEDNSRTTRDPSIAQAFSKPSSAWGTTLGAEGTTIARHRGVAVCSVCAALHSFTPSHVSLLACDRALATRSHLGDVGKTDEAWLHHALTRQLATPSLLATGTSLFTFDSYHFVNDADPTQRCRALRTLHRLVDLSPLGRCTERSGYCIGYLDAVSDASAASAHSEFATLAVSDALSAKSPSSQ